MHHRWITIAVTVAAFLLSDLAAGVTSEITYVDGGFSNVMGGAPGGVDAL